MIATTACCCCNFSSLAIATTSSTPSLLGPLPLLQVAVIATDAIVHLPLLPTTSSIPSTIPTIADSAGTCVHLHSGHGNRQPGGCGAAEGSAGRAGARGRGPQGGGCGVVLGERPKLGPLLASRLPRLIRPVGFLGWPKCSAEADSADPADPAGRLFRLIRLMVDPAGRFFRLIRLVGCFG